MRNSIRWLRLDEGWVVLAAGLFCLLAYTITTTAVEQAGLHPGWAVDLLLHLVRDVGIAFVVGGVVSLGIERLSRRKFQDHIEEEVKKIQTSAIGSAYMKDYPASYVRMIDDMLKSEKFCRVGLNVQIDITLESASEINNESVVIYDQIASGRVRNVTSSTQEFEPNVLLGKDWDVRTPELLSWKIGDRELSVAEIVSCSDASFDTDLSKRYIFPDKIYVEPGQDIYTYTRVRNYKRARDITTYCNWTSADGMRFTVSHPPELEVFLQIKSRKRGNVRPLTSDGRRVTLELFEGLLPYTAVELGWRPRLIDY